MNKISSFGCAPILKEGGIYLPHYTLLSNFINGADIEDIEALRKEMHDFALEQHKKSSKAK